MQRLKRPSGRSLNPSFWRYIALATANFYAGHAIKAVEYVETALRLRPSRSPRLRVSEDEGSWALCTWALQRSIASISAVARR